MKNYKETIKKIPGSIFLYMTIRKISALPSFISDFIKFKSKKDKRFNTNIINLKPCLIDKTENTDFEAHYIYHPAWAARIVARNNPGFHIDISSTLSFSTILSAFIPVKFYDYRPAKLNLSNLQSEKADLTKLHFEDNSIHSLSCMHTIEHIGLGRYGDPIDPDGDIKACKELSRVLAKNGSLIFVTPVGKPKIEFNAHRIYSYEQILELFPDLELKEFSLVPEKSKNGGLIRNANKDLVKYENYACGCFHFVKI